MSEQRGMCLLMDLTTCQKLLHGWCHKDLFQGLIIPLGNWLQCNFDINQPHSSVPSQGLWYHNQVKSQKALTDGDGANISSECDFKQSIPGEIMAVESPESRLHWAASSAFWIGGQADFGLAVINCPQEETPQPWFQPGHHPHKSQPDSFWSFPSESEFSAWRITMFRRKALPCHTITQKREAQYMYWWVSWIICGVGSLFHWKKFTGWHRQSTGYARAITRQYWSIMSWGQPGLCGLITCPGQPNGWIMECLTQKVIWLTRKNMAADKSRPPFVEQIAMKSQSMLWKWEL